MAEEEKELEKKPRKRAVKKEAQPEEEKKSLEEIFSDLDKLLSGMEQEESLEKSFQLYKTGINLIQQANESIDRVEKQVRVLDEEGILS